MAIEYDTTPYSITGKSGYESYIWREFMEEYDKRKLKMPPKVLAEKIKLVLTAYLESCRGQ